MGDPLWEIDATLVARGFELVTPPALYRGPISVHGKKAIVEIDARDTSFATLPTVRLIDRSELPGSLELAHIIEDGLICYIGEGGLPVDMYRPGGSILRVLKEASAALERSFGGGAPAEFQDELASYWKGTAVYAVLARRKASSIRRADLVFGATSAPDLPILVEQGAWRDGPERLRVPATIIEFRNDLLLVDGGLPSNLQEAFKFVEGQTSCPSGWRDAVVSATQSAEAVFMAAPNGILGWTAKLPESLAAIRRIKHGFRPNYLRQAISQTQAKIGLDRMIGIEADLRFCVERNLLGRPTLIGKKIALVGCGTIGGYLARLFSQSGAGCDADFVLYDIDSLRPGNLGRHLLGFSDLGKPKAGALAASLHSFHPDLRVAARPLDATKDWENLEDFDLIVDATGDPNVSSVLNDFWLRSTRSGTDLALQHTWVFGNGVAAQTFLNLKDGLACYRCLKTGFEGRWRFNPLKDENAEITQAPARCGEAGYVPFGASAPVAAAILALESTLDWAAGKPGARLRTIIVDHDAGRQKPAWTSPSRREGCEACGN